MLGDRYAAAARHHVILMPAVKPRRSSACSAPPWHERGISALWAFGTGVEGVEKTVLIEDRPLTNKLPISDSF